MSGPRIRFTRRLITVTMAGLVLAAASSSRAEGVAPVNTDRKGVALAGYDAVAYFTEGRAVEGTDTFVYRWRGATWRFASARNREAFAAEPLKYAPQFGGYCAWAVSRGYTADVDPEAWAVVGGRLYLNYSKRVQRKWDEDRPGNISRAEGQWPTLVRRDDDGSGR